MSHVMLDLETTGTAAGCCILQIGATCVRLDPRERDRNFVAHISHASCLAERLQDSESTMHWWMKQPTAVRESAFAGTTSLRNAIEEFKIYLEIVDAKTIWGNGADFDLPILRHAAEVVGISLAPWAFKGRCFRTVKNMFPMAMDANSTKHDALADARHQADHLGALARTFRLQLA